jgi:hypothetical protein
VTTECPKCHAPLALGDFPFCPHGRGETTGVEAVTWPGGITFENLGHDPVTLYSPAELKREMKARGLEPMVRHRDGDPHTRSWATMDPYTLEQGRILAERQATSKVRHTEPGPSAETVAIARQELGL